MSVWVDDDPTLELPVVPCPVAPAPSLPPFRPAVAPPPPPRAWQSVKETARDLGASVAELVATFLRSLAWVFRTLRPVLPVLVAVVLLAATVRLVPWQSLERRARSALRPPDAAAPTTAVPATTTTVPTTTVPTTTVPTTDPPSRRQAPVTTVPTSTEDTAVPKADWNRPDWELPGWPDA